MIGMFPGSFHPPTNGHMDIIRRAAELCETLYVAILYNREKHYLFSAEERKAMLEKCLKDMQNVRVVIGTGLTSDLAQQLGADTLVRGVRDTADFDYEMKLADINHTLSGIETLFLPARAGVGSVASSIVMDIALHGGDISAFVPACIEKDILTAIKEGV